MNRRSFLTKSTAASLGFLGLQRYLSAAPDSQSRVFAPFGELVSDPLGVLDLPQGFSYHVITTARDLMDDGYRLPSMPDGMAAFPGENGQIILVRNHELKINSTNDSAFKNAKALDETFYDAAYDPGEKGENNPHLGGTTTLVYDPQTRKVVKQFLSLAGTDRNCAGGAMPWGSWITCEESIDLTSERGRKHGYCFEVVAAADGKLQKAIPLKALGRFCHEAVALDHRTGILYLTEDVNDGMLYRFIPDKPRDFQNGKLQALAIVGKPQADTRSYTQSDENLKEGDKYKVKWIDLDNPEAPDNDLRYRGHRAGAAVFARGEGIICDNGKVYVCCTDGGPKRQGQIFLLTPALDEGEDTLELFIQPEESDLLTNGDNLCAAPWGDLIICEDLIAEHTGKRPHLRGITPEGKIYTLGKNAKDAGELAGSCFSPDGKILFVNMQSIGQTIAITGPWEKRSI